MPELIRFNIPFVFILVIAALSFAIVYFFYRRTNPEIKPFWKWILILLRSAVLFLILLIFFEPVVHLFYYQKKYPTVDIFIDNSQSMAIREGQGSRWAQVEKVKSLLAENLKPVSGVRWFAFNSHLKEIRNLDSLRPSKAGTNFMPLLKQLGKDAPDLAFVVSDGVITEGGLPTGLNIPAKTTVYAIPIGQVHTESDVFIQDVEFAPVAYKGQTQKITAIIGTAQWKKKENAVLTLFSQGKVLAHQTVTLMPGATGMRVSLNYIPRQEGLQRLKLEISGIKNDANALNNVFHFVQNVLKNRIQISLFAFRPNYDVKFLHLLLKQNPRFAVHWFVEDNQGRFLEKSNVAVLDSSDVWIFAPFPGARTALEWMRRLNVVWKRKHPSLALMLADDINWPMLQRLVKELPFQISPILKKEKQITVLPNENQTTNAFLNLFADRALNQMFWTQLPPISNYYDKIRFKGEHTTLLSAAYNGKIFPVVFTQELPTYKLLVFNGINFWQWHFLMQTDPEISSGYRLFLEKLMRWLAYKKPFKPVLLSANQKSGNIGESFDLTIRLVDARFQPIPNGSVLLQAQLGKQRFDLSAKEEKPGVFKAQFVPPTAGIYRLTGIGFQQDKMLGRDSLQIAVVPVDKEFIHLSPDTLFLSRLSANSGGRLLHLTELKTFLKALFKRPRTVLREKDIELWYRPEWLILILLLISVEWALRKKLNLV